MNEWFDEALKSRSICLSESNLIIQSCSSFKMDRKFLLFAVIACLVKIISSQPVQNVDRDKSYILLFRESEPPMKRDQVLAMLKNLRKLYDSSHEDAKLIDEVLDKSQVSKENCDRSARDFFIAYSGFSGHIDKFLMDSQNEQAKFCLKWWNDTLFSHLDQMDANDRDSIESMIDSMIEANSGMDFDEIWFDMPYASAQEGVLKYLDKRTRSTLSKKTKREDFDKKFDEFVSGPCERLISVLSRDSDRYNYIFKDTCVASQLNDDALKWARITQVCKKLVGQGYSKNRNLSFRQDTFENLAQRKTGFSFFK